MRHFFFICLFFILAILSCKEERKLKLELSNNEIQNIEIKRYEKALFQTNTNSLKKDLAAISDEYSFFLNSSLDDTLNIIQIASFISEPRIRELYNECINQYPETDELEEELSQVFSYYKHYFPQSNAPLVYTYVSDIFYEHPILYFDTVMIIALDVYLGEQYKYYGMLGIPQYKAIEYRKEYISRDVVKEISKKHFKEDINKNRFLDLILMEGKKLYFLDALLPDMADSIKIGYTASQNEWCINNEANLWSFIIDNELLYETKITKIKKFLSEGPFTAGLSPESPSRTGIWTGWQIIRSYMNNNQEVSLQALIQEDNYQKILNNSKYKPKK